MHHLVPLVHQTIQSKSTTTKEHKPTNRQEDDFLSANRIVPRQILVANETAPLRRVANQRAGLPPKDEDTVTDKREMKEDLQVYKMENGTRSMFLFYFPINFLSVKVLFHWCKSSAICKITLLHFPAISLATTKDPSIPFDFFRRISF